MVRFPNESEEYRAARDELLEAEAELRERLEEVAARRRRLPLGGRVEEDYVFEAMGAGGEVERVKLSELFSPGRDSLVVYGYMFGPEAEKPCPLCSSLLDGLDGTAPHVTQRTNLAVVARAPIARLARFAARRGWRHLRLLSSAGNSFQSDFFAARPGTRRSATKPSPTFSPTTYCACVCTSICETSLGRESSTYSR